MCSRTQTISFVFETLSKKIEIVKIKQPVDLKGNRTAKMNVSIIFTFAFLQPSEASKHECPQGAVSATLATRAT